MGKFLSIIAGSALAVTGIILLVNWIQPVKLVIKGTLPVVLIFGGVIALLAGVSELEDTIKAKQKK